MKRLLPGLFIFFFGLLCMTDGVQAQLDTAAVRQKIEQQQFIFRAQTAMPMKGRSINLTTSYDLRVTTDSLISYLPYFGRAYTAPINPSEAGLQFTSVNFEYNARFRKKKWEVTMRPRDYLDIQELSLTVFSNGRASLRVTSNSRQPITFDGYLVEK